MIQRLCSQNQQVNFYHENKVDTCDQPYHSKLANFYEEIHCILITYENNIEAPDEIIFIGEGIVCSHKNIFTSYENNFKWGLNIIFIGGVL